MAISSKTSSHRRAKMSRKSMPGLAFLVVLLVTLLIAFTAITPASAFGAGNIPSFSSVEGRAWRHGDVDDTISLLVKKAGGLLGRGSKFTGLDIKRVYLGSWLADMSQAMDIGSLERVSAQNIINIIVVMAFMAFGYATGDFEVNLERLGAYLPVEHIDNPKGYGGGKDPRQTDPRLRPPIDPRELEIDPRTGMKNYIANESSSWDTSSSLVRKRLMECIHLGRQARSSGDSKTLHDAYRLMGRCLHTLEDFPAHSNFCELALIKSGHHNVFSHVGDGVRVRAPDGSMVPPLVTGTFGGADFIHSLLGEASDHLSSTTVSDLQKQTRDARAQGSNPMRDLASLLGNIPGSTAGGLSRDAQELNNGPSRDPATMDPQEIYRNIYRIMAFRDRVMMSIEETIEKIPGLSSLIEKISNTLSVFVFTLLEPYINPIISKALGGLQMGSSQVISEQDQYEVFNNPQASDPTHSILSKDHFGLVLNDPAGNVACIIVRHVVTLVVKGWDDTSLDPHQIADECLAVLFHPFWVDRQRCHPVQSQMLGYMDEWGRNNVNEVRKLDREHVRAHTNTRSGHAEQHSCGGGSYGIQTSGQQGVGMGTGMAHQFQGYVGGKLQSAMGPMSSHVPGGGNFFREVPGDMAPASESSGYGHGSNHGSSSSRPQSSFPEPQHEGQHGSHVSHGSHAGHGSHGSQGRHGGESSNYYNDSAQPQFPQAQQHHGGSHSQSYASPSYGSGQPSFGNQPGPYGAPPAQYGGYPGPEAQMPHFQGGPSYPHQYGPPGGPPPPQQPPYGQGPPYGYQGGPGYGAPPYGGPPPPGSGYY